MPEMFTDYEAFAPSTPASNPEMFPTIDAQGFHAPASAEKNIWDAILPFGSGLNSPAPKSVAKAEAGVPAEDTGNPYAGASKTKPEPYEETGAPGALQSNMNTALASFMGGGAMQLTAGHAQTLGADVLAADRQYKTKEEATGLISPVAYAARESGLNPVALKKIAQIESSGNPLAITGSYKGLFQLSDSEFNKYGGGNILNAADNAAAASNKIAIEAQRFENKIGRPATVLDAYMVHQQGEAGYASHLRNPQGAAWENMLSTGEGQRKGENWAKAAIWGNIPDKYKSQFRSVNDVTSQDFINIWANRLGNEASQPILSRTKPGIQDAGTPAPRLQLAGDLMDTVLKPFGLRQKTQDERNREQKYEDIARESNEADRLGKENEALDPTLGGIKTMRQYQIDEENRKLNNQPDTRRT